MTHHDTVSNYGRVRRLASRYCWGVERQIERMELSNIEILEDFKQPRVGYAHYTLKNDWEVLLVFLTRLRRCLTLLQGLGPALKIDPDYITRFDNDVPDLKELRDFEEHFDDYSLGIGRNKNALWGYLESYGYDAEGFSNGLGRLSVEGCRNAALTVWEAVLSVESDAKALGYLTWEDRYGSRETSREREQ